MIWHVLSRLPAAVAAQPVAALLLITAVVIVILGTYRDVSGSTRRR